jgi:GxxExxY protein
MSSMDVDKITGKVIGCAYTVSNTLGIGFVEKVYENALALEIRKTGLKVEQQAPLQVLYENVLVGDFYVDLLVEGGVLIELKAVSSLKDEHTAQALNYLSATGLEVCLLINFGTAKVQIKRLLPSVYWKQARS